MKVDFAKFEHSLPYASELYGIYQPLLGWRSRVRTLELSKGVGSLKQAYLQELQLNTKPLFTLPAHVRGATGFTVSVGERASASGRSALDAVDSIVARKVSALVAEAGSGAEAWRKYTSTDALNEILAGSQEDIKAEVTQVITARHGETDPGADQPAASQAEVEEILSRVLERESSVSGALARLAEDRSPAEITALMTPYAVPTEAPFLGLLESVTPAQSDLAAATISPIGLVHLYRQYFFEFDTFLGPPVQHLWLSPGGVVELVEVSTRRTLVERTTEQTFESIEKSERSSNIQDELSDAVRSENGANTKLGVTLSSSGSYGVGFVNGSTTVGTSLNAEQSSKDAREHTGKSLRQQTAKLSSEIRKSFKSSFRTLTETTDTESRRYVISNSTENLVNYELRRKMRQVGVQVHDYGMQLCWQAYVDDPGQELGIAKLISIAAPADLQGVHEPDAPVMPEPEIRSPSFSVQNIHFGVVTGSGISAGKFIPLTGEYQLTPPKPGYIYSRAEVVLTGEGDYATLRAYPRDTAEALNFGASDPPKVDLIPTGDAGSPTEPSVRSVVLGFQLDSPRSGDGHNYYWGVDVTFIWKPSQQLLHGIETTYKAAMTKFNAQQEQAFRDALYKSAHDRAKAASNIAPRNFAELREEERIVVYRNLIRKLLDLAGITNEDPKLRHVFAELIQSMFDVDEMLYFVSPEWWMPRRFNDNRQNIGIYPKGPERVAAALAEFDHGTTVDWGGAANRPGDYYITDDSAPARLGSSLGWMLQLDGDNLRNAFLNAPWVKAIVPIRPGHEWKALAWLSSDAIEGGDGLEDIYQATDPAEKRKILDALKAHHWDEPDLASLYDAMTDPERVRIIDAIRYLIIHVQELHALSLQPVPNPDDPAMNYLPTEEVFERGFEPLPGGFNPEGNGPFKGFVQWFEVLPTDQIVPVEVKYDPKTGMQV